MKTTSINHGLICSYNFTRLGKEEINNIFFNLLIKYNLQHLKHSRNKDVVSIKQAFFLIMVKNGHKLVSTGRCFGNDHSTVIHGVNKIKEYLSVQDAMALFWYKEVFKELSKYGYKDKSNA